MRTTCDVRHDHRTIRTDESQQDSFLGKAWEKNAFEYFSILCWWNNIVSWAKWFKWSSEVAGQPLWDQGSSDLFFAWESLLKGVDTPCLRVLGKASRITLNLAWNLASPHCASATAMVSVIGSSLRWLGVALAEQLQGHVKEAFVSPHANHVLQPLGEAICVSCVWKQGDTHKWPL